MSGKKDYGATRNTTDMSESSSPPSKPHPTLRTTSSELRHNGHAINSNDYAAGDRVIDINDLDEEVTGLITPGGMEVHLATVDQKRRKWWRDAAVTGIFIAGWYVSLV